MPTLVDIPHCPSTTPKILTPRSPGQFPALVDALWNTLGTDYTAEDLAILVNNDVAYQMQDTVAEWDRQGLGEGNLVNLAFGQQLLEETGGYLMAAQVDAVREAVYNSGWDQAQEAEQLQRLRDEIAKMPDAILGVSIAHYKSALYQYRLLMQKHHDWLVKMKDWMEGYERMLLAQEAGIGEEFDMSWVLEIGLGMLWEPLDWAFAARDLFLEGELSALIGLLPIIPASIRHFDAIRHTFPSLLANVTWLRDDYRSWWRAASSKDIGDVRILADEASHVLGRQPGELYDRVTLSWGWADTKSANPRFEFDTPYFTYDSDLGGRIVSLDVVDLAGRSYEEKLLVATHELIHAEDFLNIRNLDGPGEAIKWLKDATVSSYNWDEITTEYRALKSVDEYLGGVSNDTIKESLAYIEDSFYRGIDSSLKPDYQTIIDDLRNMIN